jgi:hypothetical protein
MQRERKLIFLTVLTVFVYGLSIFLNYGSFILPFPLFDGALILLSLVFVFWNWRDLLTFRKWYFYLYLLFITLKLATNSLLWSTFFDDLEFEKFQLSEWPEWIRLSQLILIFPLVFSWLYVEKIPGKYWFSGLMTLFFFLGMFSATYFFSYLLFTGFGLYVYRYKPMNSLTYLLLLHGILDLCSLLMLSVL